MARQSLMKIAAPPMAMIFYAVYNLTPATKEEKAATQQIERSVYYSGCKAVRAAGKAPLYRGDPGYREGMDGDSDGVACEPYPR
jgi:hypothetical protein